MGLEHLQQPRNGRGAGAGIKSVCRKVPGRKSAFHAACERSLSVATPRIARPAHYRLCWWRGRRLANERRTNSDYIGLTTNWIGCPTRPSLRPSTLVLYIAHLHPMPVPALLWFAHPWRSSRLCCCVARWNGAVPLRRALAAAYRTPAFAEHGSCHRRGTGALHAHATAPDTAPAPDCLSPPPPRPAARPGRDRAHRRSRRRGARGRGAARR